MDINKLKDKIDRLSIKHRKITNDTWYRKSYLRGWDDSCIELTRKIKLILEKEL